jgi:NADPH-dependent glutamate synthase beta subunit-like oxidoreductase
LSPIVAIGQVADLSFAEKQGISVTSAGTLEADPITLETPMKGVFAGGDVYHGPASIAEAILAPVGRQSYPLTDISMTGTFDQVT